MMRILKKRCQNCRTLFVPDSRNYKSQQYCFKPECRKASKKASQEKWLSKSENQDYFRCPENVERVQKWRKNHPGYSKRPKQPHALQDLLPIQPTENKSNIIDFELQDLLQGQPTVLIGLIAHFTGTTLQDDIASFLLRMKKYGQDILCSQPQIEGDSNDCKIPNFKVPDTEGTQKFQLGRSSPGT